MFVNYTSALLSFRFFSFSLIHLYSYFLRMTNTGPGERRIMWQPSVLVTHGDWKRTRSPCAPPSWSVRTQRCGSKWLNCGRTVAAVRTSWPDMRLSMARCKELIKSMKYLWDKSRTSFPAEFHTDTNTKGNLNLHCCLCWPPVTVSSSSCWS